MKLGLALPWANPKVRLNLEMITRDPLRIPCLSDGYWTTMGEVPGRDLARMMTFVRKHAKKEPLPRLGALNPEDQQTVEDNNVRRSMRYARENLQL